jgi:hypothetical protein
VYPNDLGGNKDLESYVGHIERDDKGMIRFPDGAIPLIKTHQLPRDKQPAMYVVRDGRAVCVSLWEFYGRRQSLEAIITGQHRFGTWANHVATWQPWARSNTLLLRYEELLCDLPKVLERLSRFLSREITKHEIPERETVARVDGRWVRNTSNWRDYMTDEQIELFNKINGHMIDKLEYGLFAPPKD